jgi:hypothetical protein
MDRRDFFQVIFASPLLAPHLLDSRASANDQLFLISDRPGVFLPSLVEKMKPRDWAHGRSFFVSRTHPHKTVLSQAMMASGWTKAAPNQKADLSLSFRLLHQPSPPSFTLVRAGEIRDIRSKELWSVWDKMNKNYPRSSGLTIAAFQAGRPGSSRGTAVRIYHNGHVVKDASLNRDRVHTLRTKKGSITLKIDQGKAFIPSSSCRHKICCSVPPVSFSGERIVCAPNHFLLEVLGPRIIDTIIG